MKLDTGSAKAIITIIAMTMPATMIGMRLTIPTAVMTESSEKMTSMSAMLTMTADRERTTTASLASSSLSSTFS